ncbi:unnamed protein product [Rhizoctonia solani]|uniref:Superoxide dismutase n=1 Tax=Rhizoctonia solani TaxID=456999 RepID=A0A8H3AAB9_9AGAM|nr:unnamed protein product [Rhizoctonia solani]CAE7069350.1 unnamed protein product [Rhizoctonia solani]
MSQLTLPDLPYEYKALEPFISEEIMTLHHKKHHQTYVNGYNSAIATLSKLVGDPSTTRQQISLQSAIKFNGGGHINHSLFWKNLAPANSNESKLVEAAPTLSDAITNAFGEDFQKEFNAAALGIQGSGWVWLAYHTTGKRLEIITTPNQDPVLPPYVPIVGVDMWEHAFYLQYKNVKPDYLSAIWNVINWKEAELRYTEGQSAKL